MTNQPTAPYHTEDEALDADTYQAPASATWTAIADGTERQSAYASDLRARFISDMRTTRLQLVRRRGNQHDYETHMDYGTDGQLINHTEEAISEIESFIERAAQSTKSAFWLKHMTNGQSALDVATFFRSHPKTVK